MVNLTIGTGDICKIKVIHMILRQFLYPNGYACNGIV